MRKLDDLTVGILLCQLFVVNPFALGMSLLQGIGSVNGWNAVMALVLVGRLVVRSVVKPGK